MNSQLTIAVHILAVLAHHKDDGTVTSDVLAKGFGTNPVVIRRVLSQLKKAGLITARAGAGGGSVLAKSPDHVTLRDAYDAISRDSSTIFARHRGQCDDRIQIGPVIADYLNELVQDAERAMLKNLDAVTVQDLTKEIGRRVNPSA